VTASKTTARRRFAGAIAHPELPRWTPQSHPAAPPARLRRVTAEFPDAPWYGQEARGVPAWYDGAKRTLDVVVTVAALPFVLLVLAICALAIRLDSPGPAFFTQSRTGRGGRRFPMYKLRTMVQDAEELKARYAHLNELTPPDFRLTNDPRVTRVGRFLRKTSLDELPQMFNVLLGDMSLVGPRPTSFSADSYRLWHTARLEVKPGLTGLWQISGRNEVDFDDRLRLDIAYIRNRSLLLDLRILLRTFGAVAGGRGAS
jgi:lipopolysaccharide/colanic/teichoic acid biosynthesis glycosyltransferase